MEKNFLDLNLLENKMHLLTHKNYFIAIKKSVGTQIFQNVFAEINGEEKDITQDGELSCAYFVSSILMMFHLIDINKAPHSTISGAIKNMEKSGWKNISADNLEEGDVIVWNKIIDVDDEEHQHIGFYIGKSLAVSNSSKKRIPDEHHYTYNGKRGIESCWRMPML